MNNLLASAYKYISNGICVIAVNSEKRAFLSWKQYQDRIITNDEVEEQFEHQAAVSLAVVCGKPSGNLEVIDIDQKYSLDGQLYNEYTQAIKDNDAELFDRLMIIQTVGGGYHIYYRCTSILGNLKLASRETTPEEQAMNPDDKVRVLIETRGQGGYVVAPPSKGYKVLVGDAIPTITPDERDVLIELARSFNQVLDKPVKTHITHGYNPKEYGLSPFEDYNKRGDVIGLLTGHGWKVIREHGDRVIFRRPGKDVGTSGDYLLTKQWFSVFTTSSVFEPNKAYLPYAVYAVLECNGDFKEAARRLLSAGYGERREYYGDKIERDLYKKKKEGLDNDQLVRYLKENHAKNDNQAEEIVEKLTSVWGDKICTFWDISDAGKISINRTRLINFLHITGGFSLYYYDNSSTIFRVVRCREGFVEEVSSEHIKKFLKEYIESLPDTFDGGITSEDLLELILKGSEAYFSKGLIEFLSRSDFEFLKDTADAAFFPFNNGVVRVSKDKAELLSYKEIKKVIWRSQVIDFNILIDSQMDETTVEYMHFIQGICNKDMARVEYALSLMGYLLHKYKDPTRPYAVILAEETEDESKGGGTGKGIFVKAISKLINTERVDGKNFKLDKNFAFQRVGLDTEMICIEDVRKKMDFEGFYSIITEGITVEKKNKDELFIPYEDSPKIIFTTNYTIPNVGNHAKRRQKVFEFSSFYHPGFTPEDQFKHKLFDDWDIDEWNRFYNLLFTCVQVYFENGVMEVTASDKLKRKQIKLNYGEEFLEWFDGYESPTVDEGWDFFNTMYTDFLKESDFEKKDYSVKRFKSGIESVTEVLNIDYKERKKRNANNLKQIQIDGGKKTVTSYLNVVD